LLASYLTSFGQHRFIRAFEEKQGFLFPISFSFQNPQADFAERFGKSNAVSLGVEYKTKTNWLFGGEYNWMFSNNVNDIGMFDSIIGESGILIDNAGAPVLYRFELRGWNSFVHLGKVFPINKNKNSGLIALAGVGYWRHRVHFVYPTAQVPQVSQFQRGYDRLTGGAAWKVFVGYQFLDPELRLNLRVGYEYISGRTQSLRGYNYDTRTFDDRIRNDALGTVKVSMIVPIYTKKADEEFFFE
jgi:hypothetical protein